MKQPQILRRSLIQLCAIILLGAGAVTGDEPRVVELRPRPAGDAAPTPPESMVERGKGKSDRSISGVSIPTLTVYLPPADRRSGAAVVICPGGGYERVVIDKEGHDVARWLSGLGMTAAVLKYRSPTEPATLERAPAPIADGLRSIRLLRSRAAEWGLDPRRIGVMGFSAGGHLASTVGTHFDSGNPDAADSVERLSSRPDFMVLVYPVVSMDSKVTHGGSRLKLLGPSADEKLVRLYSNELRVTPQTPPTFIVHARDDSGVPAQNSIRLHESLRARGIACELHLYETGGHGFGLGIHGGEVASWPGRLQTWLRSPDLIK